MDNLDDTVDELDGEVDDSVDEFDGTVDDTADECRWRGESEAEAAVGVLVSEGIARPQDCDMLRPLRRNKEKNRKVNLMLAKRIAVKFTQRIMAGAELMLL